MASFNQVLLMGNLTRDPQLKYLPNQTAVAEFGMACNRKYKGANGEEREDVLFVDCAAFAKTGELIQQYFTKGKPIFIQGRLKYDSWDDKNGGGKRSKLSIVVDSFQFIGGREEGTGDAPPREREPQRQGAGANFRHPPRQDRPKPTEAPFGEGPGIPESDIPFIPNVL